MIGNVFILSTLALVSSLVGAAAWFANRAGRNSVKLDTAELDIASAKDEALRAQGMAAAAATTLSDDEEMSLLKDGKA